MKGIQINNFFNNHISLNNKKNNSKQPNLFFEGNNPQPVDFNPNRNEQQLSQINSYEALTPQMKILKKQTDFPTRKKRTNTIDPSTRSKQNRKSKGKKSNSTDKFTRTISLDKCTDRNTEQEYEISKVINKSYKKPKSSRNKNQLYQVEGVRRSKSAIIKHTNPRVVESKEISKQFMKSEKKNIISADSSFKDSGKKQIKKQTQNLLKRKQQVDKVPCKTARVESTKVKSRLNKDKIISQLQRSGEQFDKKSMKYHTERKTTAITTSKSYLTSAKQSKPVSARDKKPAKKLFDSKEKDCVRNVQRQESLYKNLDELIRNSEHEENYEVKQALTQLQLVLLGINSKQNLAKQLKKFTSKLTNIHSQENIQSSSEEESNTDAFKKIKDFKNNLVKKKLNEVKAPHQSKQFNKQQQISKKKSSKKLLNKKKKLNDPKNVKNNLEGQQINGNQAIIIETSNPLQSSSEPQVFKDTQEQQSKYINSRNVSQFQEKTFKQNCCDPNEVKFDERNSRQVLDERNKKYMQFLKSLETENQHRANENDKNGHFERKDENDEQRSQDQIENINKFLNRQNIPITKNYNSQTTKDPINNERNTNPLLERRKAEGYQIPHAEFSEDALINYVSENEEQSSQNIQESSDFKLAQIQDLKAFQQQSDKMMQKISTTKSEQKKKSLTIQLNQNLNEQKPSSQQINIKPPSSPKYDDRYPHLIKSPKFSDIEITNILAVKEKCLASKHEKMNQLVQKMYQQQLVSPKSYDYYVSQLKKQFEEQSEGIDGFKEQASQILNQINKQKNDIKAIDQLIRLEKWQQARKLMKGEHRIPSVFFGFKKNKQKAFQSYNAQDKTELNHNAQNQVSPSKRQNVGMFQNNISVTIKPQVSNKKQIDENEIQNKLKKIREANIIENLPFKVQQNKAIKVGLNREERNFGYEDSESEQQNCGMMSESLARQLDFQFDEKFRLKSNDDLNAIIAGLPKEKLEAQFDEYLKTDKVDSEDFEHYVYYQNEQGEEAIQDNSQQDEVLGQSKNRQLKQEGMFKLIQVPQSDQKGNKVEEKNDMLLGENKSTPIQINRKVIQIDEDDAHDNVLSHDELQNNQTIEQSGLAKVPKIEQQDDDDSLSDSDSLMELKLRKGFESNLFFIKEYCISLCEYIRDNPDVKSQFKQLISQPLQFDTLQLLKKYRKAVTGEDVDHYNSTIVQLQYKTQFRKPKVKAISSQLAKEFNKTYSLLKFENLDLDKKGRANFKMEKQAEAIFLQAILEVLNESLDFQRPGSIFGKPLLWANNSKHLKNMKYLNGEKTKKVSDDSDESAETYDFIFGVAIARIIQWGSCLCGFLPDTAELQNTEIDEDYVVHIRETRMAFLLQKMLAEEQATFNISELQQTEVMLCLGKIIAEQLANEASQQIFRIQNFSFNEI